MINSTSATQSLSELGQVLRIEELFLLQRVAQKINSILDLETLLDEIVGDVANTFGYDRLAVLLKDDGGRVLVIAAGWTGELCLKGTPGSEVMSPGSSLLGNLGQCFECGHDHGTGDRCLAFYYSPEFFERASLAHTFTTHRIPAIADVAPWIVQARRAIDCPDGAALEELAHGLPLAVVGTLEGAGN